MKRNTGLISAVSLVSGLMVGAGIFVLPGTLAGQAGPSAYIAVFLAALPAVFVGLFNAQLGSAIPISGGNYVYISRLLTPRFGFLIAWLFIVQGIAATTLVASGFGGYLNQFIEIPFWAANVGIVALFLLFNVVDTDIVNRVQVALVLFIVLSLGIFFVPGLFEIDPANHRPLFPAGTGPFLAAIGSFYFSYIGVTAITELGEEIKNPGRNIPLALAISIGLVAILYTAVAFVLTGVENWQQLGEMDAAVAETSVAFLPTWLSTVVTVGGLAAIATSINATLAALSRTLMQAGRDLAFPAIVGRVNDRFGTPAYALLILAVPSMVLVGIDPGIPFLSTVAVLGILTTNLLLGIALYRFPERYPEQYEASVFKLGRTGTRVVSVTGIATTLVFIGLSVVSSPTGTAVMGGWLLLGLVAYTARRRQLISKDIDLVENMTNVQFEG